MMKWNMASWHPSSPDNKELKAGRRNEVQVKSYSKQEVAKHSSKQDLRISVHGKVYNVTEYAKDHPGGWEALIEVASQDATSAFEDVGHSEDARGIMHAYLVGAFRGALPEAPEALNPSLSGVAQVVRGAPTTESKSGSSSLLNPRTEPAVFAVATAGLVYFVNIVHGRPPTSAGGPPAPGAR
ncbi:hypothetical protein EPUS_08990 [Endocarpon pusillum Z07020]|uniref:Cytochrome b5 heme-binding domain-containing protein n=1 Tax=Endocarpon pusillum (strain Z07020 / HMAS-L-300199) TaxID=1263415 RepID=U1GFC7_ENDPU|nr:uncharacterized protein EPUS_08990 [Endocarpon pusillum Z07020]ERF70803.1 hypothetical protein EPUS_08990 [Endocarpon pusillum Z07020]